MESGDQAIADRQDVGKGRVERLAALPSGAAIAADGHDPIAAAIEQLVGFDPHVVGTEYRDPDFAHHRLGAVVVTADAEGHPGTHPAFEIRLQEAQDRGRVVGQEAVVETTGKVKLSGHLQLLGEWLAAVKNVSERYL